MSLSLVFPCFTCAFHWFSLVSDGFHLFGFLDAGRHEMLVRATHVLDVALEEDHGLRGDHGAERQVHDELAGEALALIYGGDIYMYKSAY